jgi:cysteine-rich repeat protein
MIRLRSMLGGTLAAAALLLPGAARGGTDTLTGALGAAAAGSYEDFTIAARGGQVVFARMSAFVYQTGGRGEEDHGEATAAAEDEGCSDEDATGFCLQLLARDGTVLCWAERAKTPGWQRDPRLACPLPGDPAVRAEYVVRATFADEACGDTVYAPPPAGDPVPVFPYTVELEVRDAGSDAGPIAGVLGGGGAQRADFVVRGRGGETLFADMQAAIYQTQGRGHGEEEGGGEAAVAPAAEEEGGGCGGEEEDEGAKAFCLQLYDTAGNLLCWAERAKSPGWQRDPRLACVLPGPADVRAPYVLRALVASEHCGEAGAPAGASAPADGSASAAFPFLVNVATRSDAVAGCGDGVLDPREECDDGNRVDGDCCSADCRLAAADSACTDDGNPCTADRCSANGVCLHPAQAAACDDGDACTAGDACVDGACVAGAPVTCEACLTCDAGLGCVARPATGCAHPLQSGAASLELRHRSRDRLTWTWRHGTACAKDDFRPAGGAPYELCVYGKDALLLRAQTRSGAGCTGGDCWRERVAGFRYADGRDAPDGLRSIRVRSGAAGRPRISVLAAGRGLALPAMPVAGPITVQLRNQATGECWGAEHRHVRRNGPRSLDARGD